MERTITEIQKEVDDWAQQFEKPYFEPLSMIATMAEELGEVSRVVNDMYGDKKKKEGETLNSLEDELADLLFTIVCMANYHNISLNDAQEKKLAKLYGRDNNRFSRK